MADVSRAQMALRWLRDRWDAELLACLPVADAEGRATVLDFPHPVNRSPLWRLLRPWMLAGTALALTLLLMPVPYEPELGVVGYWFGRLLSSLFSEWLLGITVYAKAFPPLSRRAYRRYRDMRWRGNRLDDARDARPEVR